MTLDLSMQLGSTLIAIFGFSGYTPPRYKFDFPRFSTYSNGKAITFWTNPEAPIGLTESVYTASVLGCL